MTRWATIALSLFAGFASGAVVIHGVHAQAKPPAYTIAEFEVTDAAAFKQYGDATRTSVPAAGGRFIVRGGKTSVVNGPAPKQVVVIQWDSLERAQAFFDSEPYKQLVPVRDKGANFRAFLVEGAAP